MSKLSRLFRRRKAEPAPPPEDPYSRALRINPQQPGIGSGGGRSTSRAKRPAPRARHVPPQRGSER